MNGLSPSYDNPLALLKQVFHLNKVKDPEEDLEAAQIDARRLLLAAEQGFISQNADGTMAPKIAAVRLLIAKNCIDASEYDEAEKYLMSGLKTLSDSTEYNTSSWGIQTESQVLLGVSHNKRYKIDASLAVLEKAKNAFVAMESNTSADPPLTPEGLLLGSEDEMNIETRKEYYQQLYTHGLYYLAQVHLQLGHKEEAAFYCQKTLARQISNQKTLDAHDWAINCASLAQVFLDDRNYEAAVHYLACALSMEDRIRETKPDVYPEFHACMHRCMAGLGLCLLETYVDSFNDATPEADAEIVKPSVVEASNYLRQDELSKLGIDVRKIESALLSHPPKNYEQARDVFLFTQRSLLEARDSFFQIDTQCNDYIEITQSYSKLFKLMVSIEPDLSRRVAMHRRRVEMLTALIDRLNPQFYLLRYRQLVYELAETYSKMVDIELAVVEHKKSKSASTSKHEEKINTWVDASIAAFNKYLNSLKQPLNDSSKPLPDPLPESDVRPVICAYLSMGRLYSKKFSYETRERLANLLKSEQYYKEIRAYCDCHENVTSSVKAEYDAAVDLLNLMPVKLEAVRNGEM